MVELEDTVTPTTSNKPQKVICAAIKKADIDLRKTYPILNNQDTIGMIIFLSSLIAIGICWWLYWLNPMNYYYCGVLIVVIGFFTSLLHELEHDLIHNLYFKRIPIIQDIMFFFIWVSKLHGNPWYRREMHLKHHNVSGQPDDAEERLIGLGIPIGWKRFAVSLHPFGMLIATKEVAKDSTWLNVAKMNLSSAPVAFVLFGLNKIWMIYIACMFYFGNNWIHYLPERHWWWIRWLNVVICLPNLLRQSCLQVMSNTSHYYGDIPENSVFYQNQILDHPILYPFQFFCMNFGKFIPMRNPTRKVTHCCLIGATHIVHHYFPNQPFYIREIVYRQVKSLMVEQGVRINDFGVVKRSNHYYDTVEKTTISPNNSHYEVMIGWLLLLSSVGPVLFPIYDQWAMICMSERIFRKYIKGTKEKTN